MNRQTDRAIPSIRRTLLAVSMTLLVLLVTGCTITADTTLGVVDVTPSPAADACRAHDQRGFDYDDNDVIKIEYAAPHAVGGDSGGNYAPFELTTGDHTLRATPRERADGLLRPGLRKPIHFGAL